MAQGTALVPQVGSSGTMIVSTERKLRKRGATVATIVTIGALGLIAARRSPRVSEVATLPGNQIQIDISSARETERETEIAPVRTTDESSPSAESRCISIEAGASSSDPEPAVNDDSLVAPDASNQPFGELASLELPHGERPFPEAVVPPTELPCDSESSTDEVAQQSSTGVQVDAPQVKLTSAEDQMKLTSVEELPHIPAVSIRVVPTPHAKPQTPQRVAPVALVTRPQLGRENIIYLQSRLNEAIERAERGALYSSRSMLIETLRESCRMLDATAGGRQHTQALVVALRALDEANDFQYRGMQCDADLEVDSFITGHETQILKGRHGVSALRARDAYYDFARRQLIIACGGQQVAANASYTLGRVESMLRHVSPPQRKDGPREIPLFEACLAVDPQHAVAANELGVALAECGQLRRAAGVLHKCVALAPTPRTLANLATVYQRLGEPQHAAIAQAQIASFPASAGGASDYPEVRLVSVEEFSSGPNGNRQIATTAKGQVPAPVATRPPSSRGKRRDNSRHARSLWNTVPSKSSRR